MHIEIVLVNMVKIVIFVFYDIVSLFLLNCILSVMICKSTYYKSMLFVMSILTCTDSSDAYSLIGNVKMCLGNVKQ